MQEANPHNLGQRWMYISRVAWSPGLLTCKGQGTRLANSGIQVHGLWHMPYKDNNNRQTDQSPLTPCTCMWGNDNKIEAE